jgi:enoyl-CoA hydratase
MELRNLLIDLKGSVAEVTVNRPDKLNALNSQTLSELHDAFCSLEKDEAVRAIILTGAGEKAFVAGADIAELKSSGPREAEEVSLVGQKAFRKIETLKKPVIAMINGYALGGGCELAMSCHLRYGSEKAVLGQPEINLAVITGFAGSQRLARLVGRGRALELLLLGDAITAQKALEFGLLNGVFKPEELRDKTFEIAAKLSGKAPIALSSMIEAVVKGNDLNMDDGGRFEASLFGLLFTTEDLQEGMGAFLEKRKPRFKGK